MAIYKEYILPDENCPDPLPKGSQIWFPLSGEWSDRCNLGHPVQGQRLTTEENLPSGRWQDVRVRVPVQVTDHSESYIFTPKSLAIEDPDNPSKLVLILVEAAGGKIVLDKKTALKSTTKFLKVTTCQNGEVVYETVDSPYGFCPHCKAVVVSREKRPNGNDQCQNKHIYPSSASIKEL